jgi:Fe2+ transport system protein B
MQIRAPRPQDKEKYIMTATTSAAPAPKKWFTGVVRRSIGFVVAAPALVTAGYVLAWNKKYIEPLLANMGGILPFALAVVALVLAVLAIFWPTDKWPEGWRRAVIIASLVAAWFGRDAFAGIVNSGWSLLLVFGTLVLLGILWIFTAYDIIGKLRKQTDR